MRVGEEGGEGVVGCGGCCCLGAGWSGGVGSGAWSDESESCDGT